MTFPFMYWESITSVWCYIVHVLHRCYMSVTCRIMGRRHLAALDLQKSISVRNAVLETKVPDFVLTVSKTINCG